MWKSVYVGVYQLLNYMYIIFHTGCFWNPKFENYLSEGANCHILDT